MTNAPRIYDTLGEANCPHCDVELTIRGERDPWRLIVSCPRCYCHWYLGGEPQGYGVRCPLLVRARSLP